MSAARNGSSVSSRGKKQRSKRLVLSAEEAQTVLQACRRYRNTIPVYLAASQHELRLLRAVMRKLA
jgi:hypothetical protein